MYKISYTKRISIMSENIHHKINKNIEITKTKNEALLDLLKVLLKSICEEHGVSQKLVASVSDLEEVSRGVPDIPVMKGWRYEIFGKLANQLCNGEISLTAVDRSIKVLKMI